MFSLILSNFSVGLSAFYILKLLNLSGSFVDVFLSWFLFYFSLIVGTQTFLGIFGWLASANIIALHLCILFLFFLIQKKTKYPFPKLPDFSFIFENKILLFSASVFLGFFTVKAFVSLINPPIGADSLMYHLTFPVSWLKNANLQNQVIIFSQPSEEVTTNSALYYPISAELLFFWLMFPLKNAFLANGAQAPFYFIAILAIYSVFRKFDIEKSIALLTALLWALIPNVLKQLREGAYIDIICAALFFMLLNFLLILYKEFRLRNAFIFGLTLGLFIGTKTLNIFWAFSLVPLFAYVLFKHREKVKLQVIFINLLAVLGATFISGGYPYLRNYILTKNMFYPITVKMFGKLIMPGCMDRLTYANLTYSFHEFSLSKLFFREGLGGQLFLFILPATLIPILSLVVMKKNHSKLLYFSVFVIPAILFSLYLFYIKAYWSRYLYSYLGAGLIAAGIFLGMFGWGRLYLLNLGFLCVISSITELGKRLELFSSIVLSVGLFVFFILIGKRFNLKVFNKNSFLCPVVLIILLLSYLNYNYNKNYYTRYTKVYKEKEVALAWKWLNENTNSGMNIAYTGRNTFYPLFGDRLKNNVFYIPINNGLRQGAEIKDYAQWLINLKEKDVVYLFIFLPYKSSAFPIEDGWASAHPQDFSLAFSNPKVRIYRVSGQGHV